MFGGGRAAFLATNVITTLPLKAAKPMSDMALDSFNRCPRYTLSFSYQL